MLSARNIANALNLESRTMADLLALRLLFDDPKDVVDLDQDIYDLTVFPERLEASYRHEWCTFIARAIAVQYKQNTLTSETAYCDVIARQLQAIQGHTHTRYNTLLSYVEQAQGVDDNGNIVSFPHPLKQRIEKLLLLK